MKVYMFSGSGFVWRVQLACVLKGVPYDQALVEASERGLKSPQFLALNPRGRVPALRDGGFVLSESSAILAYLERKHPEPPLFGRSAQETGLIWKAILDFDLYVSFHWVSDILRPVFTGQAEAHADPIKEGFREAADELAKLEAQIAGRDWFVGGTVSAADITIYPLLEGLLRAAGKPDMEHIDHGLLPFGDRHPNLEAWMNRIRALPGYDETYPANWREIDGAPRQPSKSGGVAGTVRARTCRNTED